MATVSKEESITKAADRIKLIVLLALLIFSGYDLAHANLENCFSEKELSTVVDVNRRGLVDAMVIISTNHRYDELTGKFYDPLNQYDSSFVLYSLFLHSYRMTLVGRM